MIHLAALVSGTGWHVADLLRAADRLAIRLDALPFAQVRARIGRGAGESGIFADSVNLLDVDGVLVRMMPPGTLEQVVFRMDALHRVASAGISVSNPPRTVEAAVDKYLTLAILDSSGIPVPATWTGQTANEALVAFDALGGDVVVKPLFGSEGRGVMRVSDRELAWRAFWSLERLGSILYLQEVIEHPGYDLRIFVLRGRVLGAMKRAARDGEWRTNVALGGHAEVYQLDASLETLALDAARALGADMAGIDIMLDQKRQSAVVLEVNAVPGWRALARVTGVDVAAEILNGMRESIS